MYLQGTQVQQRKHSDNQEKSPSMVVEEFAGTTKSVMISGSLAVTMATNVTKRTAFSKVEAMVLVYISFQQMNM